MWIWEWLRERVNIITYCNRKPGDGWSTDKRLSMTASRKGGNMGRKVREKLTLARILQLFQYTLSF